MNYPLAPGLLGYVIAVIVLCLIVGATGIATKNKTLARLGVILAGGSTILFASYAILDQRIGFGNMSALWAGLLIAIVLGLCARSFLNRR